MTFFAVFSFLGRQQKKMPPAFHNAGGNKTIFPKGKNLELK